MVRKHQVDYQNIDLVKIREPAGNLYLAGLVFDFRLQNLQRSSGPENIRINDSLVLAELALNPLLKVEGIRNLFRRTGRPETTDNITLYRIGRISKRNVYQPNTYTLVV
jgi:hypothetical protein